MPPASILKCDKCGGSITGTAFGEIDASGCRLYHPHCKPPARGMEARSGETEGLDPKGDSPVGNADAPKQESSPSSPAAEVREAFEAAISASPYERSVSRYPDDATRSAWPGNYRDIAVDLAWCMWQEAWRLSTTPAQRLSEEQITAEFRRLQKFDDERLVMDLPDFAAGVRFAEKHHGIGSQK
jgi:hypothetical protein